MGDVLFETLHDVVIIGGGFAGTAAAVSLSRQGLRVCLVDLAGPPKPAFRAEKFSADQLPLLEAVGLLEAFKAQTVVATRAINIRGQQVVDSPPVEDHGLMYADMVQLLRDQLPPGLPFVHAKVQAIDTAGAVQGLDGEPPCSQVLLEDGRRLRARLVVLATGHARGLRESLGITRRLVHPVPTVNIAFTLKAPDTGFGFPSLSAYGEETGDGVDYTSVFPVGDSMRVNTFVFGQLTEPRVLAFKRDPMAALFALQPGLARWIGDCQAIDKAEFFAVEISICDGVRQPGLVLIGDAYRTSCPAVGSGLSCVLVDVQRLTALAPGWLTTPGLGADKVAQFYDDPRKRAMDYETHDRALQRRHAVTSRSLGNRVRRAAHFARRRLADQLAR